MPLRDHFGPPLANHHSWDEVHGQWPAMIVLQLYPMLPAGYEAAPRVHLGSSFEIDIATFETPSTPPRGPSANGGAATAVEAPPAPSLSVATDLPEQDEYEVRVYDARRGRRLVAAIEIVSPANKDRPENRAAFMAKCLSLLQQRVSVSIVDLVTVRDGNLYTQLLTQLDERDPTLADPPPGVYAVTCRIRPATDGNFLDGWSFPLKIGEPLPRLPLWLADHLLLWLDLESSYEQTCKVLHLA